MNEKQQIENILNILIKRRSVVENQISKYPEGTLRVRKQNKKGKEYITLFIEHDQESGDKRKMRTSITSKKELVQVMSRKKYLQTADELLANNIEVLETALGIIANTSTDDILNALEPEIKENVLFQRSSNYRLPETPEAANLLLEWINTPYPKNMNHPQYLKHRTSTGELMRSKSEVLIFEKLKEFGIAAKYEYPLQIGESILYPDFTIMRSDGKIFYWEHAGRCDLKRYRDDIIWKIRTYEGIGIGQWDNLIITYDTGDGQIDLREIESIIVNKLII